MAMDVVGNIMMVMDIATAIKDRVDTVRGFEERTKRLSTRVQILTNVLHPLRNVISANKKKLDVKSAIQGVKLAVVSLRTCMEQARDFIIKLAGKRLAYKFMNSNKYNGRFQEITEELAQVHQDLQMALQTEVIIRILSN